MTQQVHFSEESLSIQNTLRFSLSGSGCYVSFVSRVDFINDYKMISLVLRTVQKTSFVAFYLGHIVAGAC